MWLLPNKDGNRVRVERSPDPHDKSETANDSEGLDKGNDDDDGLEVWVCGWI